MAVQGKTFKVNPEVKDFAKLTLKKFKKENKDLDYSKKEIVKAYYEHLINQLPIMIEWVVRYGHIQEAQEAKAQIMEKLTDRKLVKKLQKYFKEEGTEGFEMLPIVIFAILEEEAKAFRAAKEDSAQAEMPEYVNELLNLSKASMKKKFKKLEKAGVNTEMAFDVLSVIPTTKVISDPKFKGYFRYRMMMKVIYRDAAHLDDIHFDAIAKYVIKKDMYPGLIAQLMLERNDVKMSFNDNQIKAFNDITTWCFNKLEELPGSDKQQILTAYFNERKKDAAQNKDSARRMYLSSLPESEFPTTVNAINKIVEKNPLFKDFM